VPARRENGIRGAGGTHADGSRSQARINTAESRYAAATKRYGGQDELASLVDTRHNVGADPGTEIAPGFTLTLDAAEKGYWFEIKDTTDPCGFRFISNQNGVIFTARPIQ
jgi:hypothetical protein